MKFDFCIGNPPYQEETEGTSDKPVYNYFMDEAYKIADKTVLISPARFLFNAGKTPTAWNEKMLNDPHLKVLFYDQVSGNIFPTTNIMGGVVITFYNNKKRFIPIGVFTSFPELNSILKKVISFPNFSTIDNYIEQQNKWDLDILYKEYPEYKSIIGSNGTEKRLTTPIFSSLSIFKETKDIEDVGIIGLINNRRYYKYINPKFLEKNHKNLYKYKIIVPASNGSGAIGETAKTPLIGEPLIGEPSIGYTQSFIGIGLFEKKSDAESCLKYIKGKFSRTLLGVLKVTQHNHKGVWKYVPLQDFTSNSDIDWNVSIPNIDRQLYKKYGLSAEEIEFIETHVKEME